MTAKITQLMTPLMKAKAEIAGYRGKNPLAVAELIVEHQNMPALWQDPDIKPWLKEAMEGCLEANNPYVFAHVTEHLDPHLLQESGVDMKMMAQALYMMIAQRDERYLHQIIKPVYTSDLRGAFVKAAAPGVAKVLLYGGASHIEQTLAMDERGAFTLADGMEQMLVMFARDYPDLLEDSAPALAQYLEFLLPRQITKADIDELTDEDIAQSMAMGEGLASALGIVSGPKKTDKTGRELFLELIAEQSPLLSTLRANPVLAEAVRKYCSQAPEAFPESLAALTPDGAMG